jgi:F-type H+-transporting ATPase subunit c
LEPTLYAKFIGAALAVGFGALGSGASEGYTAGKAANGIVRQPKVSGEILRTMLISQAVTETSGIFGLLVAILLLFVVPSEGGLPIVVTYISAGICMGLGGIGAGLGCGTAGGAACEAVARNPRATSSIILTTLIGQAISQTGCIFALVVSLLLLFIPPVGSGIGLIGALIGAGFAMGFGAIGAGTNSGYATARAVTGISRNPRTGSLVLRIMLLGQAVEHAGAIYSLIIAFLLILGRSN